MVLVAGIFIFFLLSPLHPLFQDLISINNKQRPPSEQELLAIGASLTFSDDQAYRASHFQDKTKLVDFGRRLFFDKRFSQNGTVACANCHNPGMSFTDGKAVAEGIGKTTRNTPTIINSAFATWFFWDGRADSLAAQALGPIENPLEHGSNRSAVVQTLKKHYLTDYEMFFGPWPADLATSLPPYTPPNGIGQTISNTVAAYGLATIGSSLWQATLLREASAASISPLVLLQNFTQTPSLAYPAKTQAERTRDLVFAHFGQALGAFEQRIVANDSAFDRFIRRAQAGSDVHALFDQDFGQETWDGFAIFAGKGQCLLCHNGPNFSDQQFHNTGLPAKGDGAPDWGRAVGALTVKADPYNCLGGILPKTSAESCLELPFLATESLELVGAFKTPTLRNLLDTAPYGHDGRFQTLQQVLRHYNDENEKPAIGHREESLRQLRLTKKELADLEAFLRALQSRIKEM